MINETAKGYEVKTPGSRSVIIARTLEEANGVLAGLQGATEKSNPHQYELGGQNSREYWRWESGRVKGEEFREHLPADGDKTNRRLGLACCLLSALFVIAAILAAIGLIPNWSL